MPNFPARRQAVPLHDIDHILTEYQTDWQGEWQISAYEIGTGCGKYWAGWMSNLQGIVFGAVLLPRKCLRAFARGRRSQGVIHYSAFEHLLAEKVGELRQRTTLPDLDVAPTLVDAALFFTMVLTSIFIFTAPVLVLAAFFLRW